MRRGSCLDLFLVCIAFWVWLLPFLSPVSGVFGHMSQAVAEDGGLLSAVSFPAFGSFFVFIVWLWFCGEL